jgi:hypothetical protein
MAHVAYQRMFHSEQYWKLLYVCALCCVCIFLIVLAYAAHYCMSDMSLTLCAITFPCVLNSPSKLIKQPTLDHFMASSSARACIVIVVNNTLLDEIQHVIR